MFYLAYRNDRKDTLVYATDSASDMAEKLGVGRNTFYCELSRQRKSEERRRKARIQLYAYRDKDLEG